MSKRLDSHNRRESMQTTSTTTKYKTKPFKKNAHNRVSYLFALILPLLCAVAAGAYSQLNWVRGGSARLGSVAVERSRNRTPI